MAKSALQKRLEKAEREALRTATKPPGPTMYEAGIKPKPKYKSDMDSLYKQAQADKARRNKRKKQ